MAWSTLGLSGDGCTYVSFDYRRSPCDVVKWQDDKINTRPLWHSESHSIQSCCILRSCRVPQIKAQVLRPYLVPFRAAVEELFTGTHLWLGRQQDGVILKRKGLPWSAQKPCRTGGGFQVNNLEKLNNLEKKWLPFVTDSWQIIGFEDLDPSFSVFTFTFPG